MMRFLLHSVLIAAVLLTASCASYMYGYTLTEAEDRFVLVGDDAEDYGRRRLGYVMGYSSPIEGFVETHGYPDMTYETTVNGRAAIALYYVLQDEVYVFMEQNWSPDSRFLLEHRSMSADERTAWEQLAGVILESSI